MPRWEIRGPDDYAYTPEELNDIGRAVQLFESALPSRRNFVVLENIGVIGLPSGAEAALATAEWSGPPVPKEPPF